MGWWSDLRERWRVDAARALLALDADAQAMMEDMSPEEREELVRSHVEHMRMRRRDKVTWMDRLRERD